MNKTNQRKTVEVGRKRIPLKKLLHGKEIRVAAKALEDFRLKLIEQEFLLGAKIFVQMDNYGEAVAVAKRPETDNEYSKRMEKARLASEAKKERERKRKIAEVKAEQQRQETRKLNAINNIENLIINNNLSAEELLDMLEKKNLIDKTK